jgi:hypothetical protein
MRRVRILTAAAAGFAITLAAYAGEVKTDLPGLGSDRQLVQKDEPTSAGSFDGTWIYVNRDMHFALWIRTRNGVPQVKVKYQSLASPEAFESDWEGKSLYYLAGNPVDFELKLGESTSDRIVGKWTWVLTVGNSLRRETADIEMYRTVYGRTLLMDFGNYEKTITSDGKSKIFQAPVVWNWAKISNRELLWEELPY